MKNTFYVGDHVSLATNPYPISVIYKIMSFRVVVEDGQVKTFAELEATKTLEYEGGRILKGAVRDEDVVDLLPV